MEWTGFIALILILCYMAYPGKVDKLEKRMKKLEKKEKGDCEMSRILEGLVGKQCKITTGDGIVIGGNKEVACQVLDVDDEWVKIEYTNKKGTQMVEILRVEKIDKVEMVN